MMAPEIVGLAGEPIDSVESWRAAAPPQRPEQWQDGRSAKELAKAWFPTPGLPQVPAEYDRLLASSSLTRGAVFGSGWAEHRTAFDDFTPPRHHDLLLTATSVGTRIVLGIEAKADEPFGTTVGEVLATAEGKARSNLPTRLSLLRAALFPALSGGAIAVLRYQLLYAAAATAVEASRRGAHVAILVIHELVASDRVAQPALDRNQRDLDAFVTALAGCEVGVQSEQLCGPFRLAGGQFISPGGLLMVGKVRRDLPKG